MSFGSDYRKEIKDNETGENDASCSGCNARHSIPSEESGQNCNQHQPNGISNQLHLIVAKMTARRKRSPAQHPAFLRLFVVIGL
ncbi:MAG: hypothetical protein JWM16_3700 [Verrucomicrobiales bacterium]|nr:hypothetical protein [Verrucomicrobiales bacterium]